MSGRWFRIVCPVLNKLDSKPPTRARTGPEKPKFSPLRARCSAMAMVPVVAAPGEDDKEVMEIYKAGVWENDA